MARLNLALYQKWCMAGKHRQTLCRERLRLWAVPAVPAGAVHELAALELKKKPSSRVILMNKASLDGMIFDPLGYHIFFLSE